LDLAWSLVAGARTAERARTAPRPAHGARPSAANTGARHCFLASASGPQLWPDVCAMINSSTAVAYIYEMWLSLAIKRMAPHPTPLTRSPGTRIRYALASEIGLLAGNACVLAPRAWRARGAVAPNPALAIGVVGCRGPWSVGCTQGAVADARCSPRDRGQRGKFRN
jgi:hypothetical protein